MRASLSRRRFVVAVVAVALAVGAVQAGLLRAASGVDLGRGGVESSLDLDSATNFRASPTDWFLGKRVNLTHLRGQRFVINFWKLSCDDCDEEAETFALLEADRAYRDIVRIGVAMGRRRAPDLRAWARKHRRGFRSHVHDRRGLIAKAYEVRTPSTYVVDADLTIVATVSAPADFDDLVDALKKAAARGN